MRTDQFTAAVKDLLSEKFSEGKFGTIVGITIAGIAQTVNSVMGFSVKIPSQVIAQTVQTLVRPDTYIVYDDGIILTQTP